jgi:hypothetical protein
VEDEVNGNQDKKQHSGDIMNITPFLARHSKE